eukprot:TRINITY_DN8985_c0_g1_i3.p1 TRINITY_DN8985_c0_g1~~TRINITY_DN8985_c0_g1_i3.p1  ORF type:complete len:648 (+),score=165.01 TRINITY_DN8985_c0_g1_i3:78-2021(+)
MAGSSATSKGNVNFEDLDADNTEMKSLLATCRSNRVKQELKPWFDINEDLSEMSRLLSVSCSQRIASELRPWMTEREERLTLTNLNFSPQPRTVAEANQKKLKTPQVLLAGCRGTGKRLLRSALTDSEDSNGVIETKYYSAPVEYVCLDIDATDCKSSDKEALESAEAVVLLWDLNRPETFDGIRLLLPDAANGDGEEDFMDEGPERVQLCVAIDEGLPGQGNAASDGISESCKDEAEDRARAWCIDHGYELLRCSLKPSDLDSLRERHAAAKEGRPSSLLTVDTDGSSLRIIEALECHASWPGMQRKAAAKNPPKAPAEIPQEAAKPEKLPEVVIAGLQGVGHEALAAALLPEGFRGSFQKEASQAKNFETVLETKYYKARLGIRCVAIQKDLTNLSALAGFARRATSLILTWDPQDPKSLEASHRLFDEAFPGTSKIESSSSTCGVKLLVEIDRSPANEETAEERERKWQVLQNLHDAKKRVTTGPEHLEWCTERGFEALSCRLSGAGLQALSQRWFAAGAAGTPLLECTSETESEHSEWLRIVEALECYAWPGMETKQKKSSSAAIVRVRPPGGTGDVRDTDKLSDSKSTNEAQSVEDFDKLAQEMKKVRALDDDNERRERACDLAMKLAASLGMDESDDDIDS